MDGHLDGVIPADLYKAEQRGITSALTAIEGRLQNAHAQLGELESNLKAVLDLIENCYDAYGRASDRIRRTHNQAFWERIRIGWDEPTSGDLAEPFQIIWKGTAERTSSEVDQRQERNQIAPRHVDRAQGSREQLLVHLLGRYCNSPSTEMERVPKLRARAMKDDVERSYSPRGSGRARRLHADEVKEVVAAYERLNNMRAVARQLRVSRETVAKYLREAGIDTSRSMSGEQIVMAVRLYKKGLSSVVIGKQLGFDNHTIISALRDAGVEIRRQLGR